MLSRGKLKKLKENRYSYMPQNLKKCKNKGMSIYKSTWERTFAIYLDHNPDVLEWGYETSVIWYFDPVTRKRRMYKPDFDVKFKNKGDFIIEIKPKKETRKPRNSKRKSQKSLIYEGKTFQRNLAKWEAAEKYCKKMGKQFQILTEKELFR